MTGVEQLAQLADDGSVELPLRDDEAVRADGRSVAVVEFLRLAAEEKAKRVIRGDERAGFRRLLARGT